MLPDGTPEEIYQRGVDYENDGYYVLAYTEFDHIRDYLDASEKADHNLREHVRSEMADGNYRNAVSYATKMNGSDWECGDCYISTDCDPTGETAAVGEHNLPKDYFPEVDRCFIDPENNAVYFCSKITKARYSLCRASAPTSHAPTRCTFRTAAATS